MLGGRLRRKEKKMKIITWNMHYCNYHAFQSKELHEYHYLNHLSAWEFMIKKVQPDIALLQEVNPVRKYSDNLIYQKSHTSEDEQIFQWGTGIYISQQIKDTYKIIDLTEEFFPRNSKYDGKSVLIKMTTSDKKDLFILSLHTDTKDYSNESKDITVDHLNYIFRDEIIQKIGTNYIVGGDFNIDEKMYNGKYDGIFKNLYDKGFISVVDKPMQTFYGDNCGNQSYFMDDYIFINNSMINYNKKSFIWNYGLVKSYSDHTIVETNIF